MTEGDKAAFCRLVMRGRTPTLACHDLGITPADVLDAFVEDAQFAQDGLCAILYLSWTTFEERFPTE